MIAELPFEISEFENLLQKPNSDASGLASFFTAGEIWVTRVPARLDVMGGIADYSGSNVCESVLGRGVLMGLQSRTDRTLRIRTMQAGIRSLPIETRVSLDFFKTGTPIDLFERPMHTFVGHFIGSPGMNVLPCEVSGGMARFAGRAIATGNAKTYRGTAAKLEIGVRPEFVKFAKNGIPVDVVKVADAGRYRIVDTHAAGCSIKLLVAEGDAIPEGKAHLVFDPARTQLYENGWMAGARP